MTRYMLFVGIVVVLGAPGMAARAERAQARGDHRQGDPPHGGEEKLAGLSGFTLKERMVYPAPRPGTSRSPCSFPAAIATKEDHLRREVDVVADRARRRPRLDEAERPRDALSPNLHRELLQVHRALRRPAVDPQAPCAAEKPSVPVLGDRRVHRRGPPGGRAADEARGRAGRDLVLRQGIGPAAQERAAHEAIRGRGRRRGIPSTGITKPSTASRSPASRRTMTTGSWRPRPKSSTSRRRLRARARSPSPDRSPRTALCRCGGALIRNPVNRIPKGAIDVEA